MNLIKLFENLLSGKKKPIQAEMLVFGFGNPGEKYFNTRHNVGFQVVDALAEKTGSKSIAQRCKSVCLEGTLGNNQNVVLVKPQTYMNNSGEAVSACLNEYKLPLRKCLVVVDDFNLPLGTFRFRKGGSHGGHNGLKSVCSLVGSEFSRLRIGIGPLPQGTDIISFVLGHYSDQELLLLKRVIDEAVKAVVFSLENGLDKAMNKYNSLIFE